MRRSQKQKHNVPQLGSLGAMLFAKPVDRKTRNVVFILVQGPNFKPQSPSGNDKSLPSICFSMPRVVSESSLRGLCVLLR